MYQLRDYFIREVTRIDSVFVNGVRGTERSKAAPHIVSVSVEGVRSEVLLHSLEEKGIYISAGSACSSNKDYTLECMADIIPFCRKFTRK